MKKLFLFLTGILGVFVFSFFLSASPARAIPASLPQDLLPEPIAPSLIQSTALPKGGEEIKVEYNSLNALDNVLKFYQQTLAAKGWSVETVSQDSRQVRLKVSKEGKAANFSLVQTETSGTQVSVVYNTLTK